MITNIHFVGIKGVGMASLAIIAKEAGIQVTGSDTGEQFITDVSLMHAGITPYTNFDPEHVNSAQLVVTTGAHGGFDNPEVRSAREKGIRVVSMAEAVGMFMDGQLFGNKLKGISVAGTHGKTTTTAMIATILKNSNMDPSYFIGTSEIPSLGKSGHYGKGDYFIVEADEYATEPTYDKRPKFFWHHPKIAVITNIEHDHPDIYPDISSVRTVFHDFLLALPTDGVAVVNGDDREVQTILNEYTGRKITYGFHPNNDVILQRVHTSAEHTFFHVTAFGTDLGEFMLQVPGEHNCLNALVAVIVGLEVGLPLSTIKLALKAFAGSKRRLEYIGKLASGALLYDDYGHHPTEVKKTLETLRAMYPNKQIVCIFQPHTYSRTKALLQDFSYAFQAIDAVIYTEIFASAREGVSQEDISQKLVEATNNVHKNVQFLPTLSDVVKYLDENKFGDDYVIVTMGAGDVYKVGEQLELSK